MKIAILGTGMVGGALGKSWARLGHEITFGVRDTASPKLAGLLNNAPNSRAKGLAEAAAFAEVVVLATPWEATQEAIVAAGGLSGRIVFDATNPIRKDFSGLAVGLTSSGGEMVAGWASGAKVVKIFNSTGFGNMENPKYGDHAATMFYCGDDPVAKETAKTLAQELGFDAIDVGPLSQARLLEPLAMLWVSLAFGGHGREIAFKLLRR